MSQPSYTGSTAGLGRNLDTFSSRSAYPTFLTPQDTALLHLKAAGRGILDACRWDVVIRLIASDDEVRSSVLKSLLFSSVSLASIYFFDLLLTPLTHEHPHWLSRNARWFYQVFWLFPVMGLSTYLNSAWYSQLARRTFTLQHGSRAAEQGSSSYSGILNSIATSAYRFVMAFTSVAVSFALQYVPVAGPAAAFAFMCWIDAYYCFEYIWIARGYSLTRRLRHLEERWAYYLAFGLPSTCLCMWGSSLANAAIFALVFPAFIIMSIHARPIPIDPYNPSGEDALRHPSPYMPIRIPIFTVVLWLNDVLIRIIGLVGAVGGGGHRANLRDAHRRTLSDGVDSVEEGEGIALDPITRTSAHVSTTMTATTTTTTTAPRAGPQRIRVSRGAGARPADATGRRKLD